MKKINKGDTVGSLTSIQKEVLVGSLLGDGALRKQGTRTNALLEINHSIAYREYVGWKWQHFKEYVKTPPKSRHGNGKRIAYRFTTQSLPLFTEYYVKYYSGGKKEIPDDLILTPLILSVWFMDDGSKSRNAFYLNTQQFSLKDQLLLVKMLGKDLNIKSSLNRDKQYFRIWIKVESAAKFKHIVASHLLPCFYYKIDYDPVTTDSKEEI